MKLKLEDIIHDNWFKKDIESVGSVDRFVDWWKTQIYHKIKEHEFNRAIKILKKYEKYEKSELEFRNLLSIKTEFAEFYCPEDDKLFVFFPDAGQDDEYRISEFGGDGMILKHSVFGNREDAVRYCSKSGCTEEREGMLDSLIDKPAFSRSLVVYEAQKSKVSLDEYILNSKDESVMELYKERIDFLKRNQEQGLDI